MTRQQRDFTHDRAALQVSLDRFIERPCALSQHQVRALLDELTSDLGMSLTPEDYETVQSNTPTNPQAFAELAAKLDGLGTDDAEAFLPVLCRVLAMFEGTSKGSTETLGTSEAYAPSYPPIARRIAEARAATRLLPAEVAALLGITVASYWDLEAYDDEAFTCLSLRQVCALADALKVSARGLVSDDPYSPPRQGLTDVEVGAALRRQLAAMGGDVDALADYLGWDVADALRDPPTIWEKWCVNTLRDVCEPLNLAWRGLLPHRDPPW
jgi:hypothetical protein